MDRRSETRWAALVGVISAAVTLALAEVAALVLAPASSPLLAVGSLVIDLVPAWLKNLVIDLFGTADKIVLLATLGLVVLVLAAVIGVLEYRRPPFGIVGLVLVGLIATLAVITRAEATTVWAVPTVLGMIGGVVVLRVAVDRLHRWSLAATRAAEIRGAVSAPGSAAAVSRRGFLTVAVGAAAASVVVGVAARAMNAGTTAVNAVRAALKLPAPAVVAPPIPVGAQLDIDGISALVTDNADFYRIDTALQVPVIDANQWKLRITGMVEEEIEISFEELLALPLVETYVTLMCVSNEVGGQLTGNAKWLGYPIRSLLERARPLSGADVVLSTSQDGWTATTPLEVLQDTERNSLLAVGMNGEALPLEHGFPVRMVVPGLYGYVSATKWVVELKVSTFAQESAYWTDRGWSAKGPVKTSSRIDVPSFGASIEPGTVAIAGVAWAQHVGIERVEVRVDNDPWQEATLAEPISTDTWRQWFIEWEATSGDHVLEVRATNAEGDTQKEERVDVIPDGAEGWHTVQVRVA
ncbi:DMSO/TMAO reductase YedYZ molybdopterin-dependent catalytic subunit [Conyzicola lurida]|uniref:DMSO/TMAO reductase YedYZ molybdopterin-dependent catalytic subunit n=1 Tax=Conyzicola lurida TaxID=1172621 RepID=A0A841AKJ0_9MICO|nr:molybdopterin-dependent oxidoreductase [Conyzicola lurida]MBB5842231.1 DMSO/TMAO reductase YedYZ molybdopterin-dependent catalytic subunit [Conyzicola lurida]